MTFFPEMISLVVFVLFGIYENTSQSGRQIRNNCVFAEHRMSLARIEIHTIKIFIYSFFY